MQVDLKNAPARNLLPFLNRPKNPRNFFEALPLLTNELGQIIDPVFSFLWSLSSSLSSSLLSSLSLSLSSLSSSLSSSQSSQSNIQFVHLISSQRSRIIISQNHSCPNCPGLSLFTSDTILPVRLKKNPKRSNACVSLMLTAHGILPGVNYPDSERGFKAASLSAFLQQSSSTLFSIALALALALGLALALLWLFWSFG